MVKQIDITKHILVPPFTKLTAEQSEQLLSSLNVSPSQLPSISLRDPMAKAVNAKAEDIIKIERKTPTGTSPYYRRVLE